jgi:hypothetical protein
MKVIIIIEKDETGYYSAGVSALFGYLSQCKRLMRTLKKPLAAGLKL